MSCCCRRSRRRRHPFAIGIADDVHVAAVQVLDYCSADLGGQSFRNDRVIDCSIPRGTGGFTVGALDDHCAVEVSGVSRGGDADGVNFIDLGNFKGAAAYNAGLDPVRAAVIQICC